MHNFFIYHRYIITTLNLQDLTSFSSIPTFNNIKHRIHVSKRNTNTVTCGFFLTVLASHIRRARNRLHGILQGHLRTTAGTH